MEDLFAFNEECVARAIAASKIPVVSCVGHEIDFTIADFVADLRAPTPSAAAELAVPVIDDLNTELNGMAVRLNGALSRGQALKRARLERLMAGPVFAMPERIVIEPRAFRLENAFARVEKAMNDRLDRAHRRLEMAEKTLSAVDPQKVIDRGYAIITRKGKYITHAEALKAGDKLDVRLAGGIAHVQTTGITLQEQENGAEKTDV